MNPFNRIVMNITIRPSVTYALISQSRFIALIIPIRLILSYFLDVIPLWMNIPSLVLIFYYIYKVALIRSNSYTISEEQIIFERGIFSISIDYIEIYRVKDFRQTQPFLLRIIGCMNLEIVSSDRYQPVLLLEGIPQQLIVPSLRKDVEHLRGTKRVYEIDS